MPAALLGSYEFCKWKGPPYNVEEDHVETVVRAGLSDIEVWLVGEWGEPFEVQTAQFYETRADAETVKNLYKGGIAAASKALTINGNAVAGYKFKVLKVDAVVVDVLLGHVSGHPTFYRARVDATWKLLPIKD